MFWHFLEVGFWDARDQGGSSGEKIRFSVEGAKICFKASTLRIRATSVTAMIGMWF